MTDYVATVRGVLPNGRGWSTSRHITSNQSEAALLTTWQNAWTTAWNLATTGLATVYTANTTITYFEVGTLNGSMRKTSKSPATVSLVGTATGDAGADNTAIVVDWLSSGTLRNQRGRQKLPAPAESQVAGGVLLSTPATNVKAAMDSIVTAVRADGSSYFVFPRYATEAGVPAFTKTQLIGNALIRNQLGTQNKRERKVAKTYT
jgi:uncharacterized membrane protein